jgi:hypothetical protein
VPPAPVHALDTLPGMPGDSMDRYFADLQRELAEERASALNKAGKKVELAMARCDDLRTRLRSSPPDEHSGLLAGYREARKDFDEALWAYCVQREALGLHDHRWVHRIYVAPPRVHELEAS